MSGYLSPETKQLLSVDNTLRLLCQRAEDERNKCLPGRQRLVRGLATLQHQISVYLLENLDNGGEVSDVVCHRLKDIQIPLRGESFLKLMEIIVGELDNTYTKKDLIRTPIPVRSMKRSFGPGYLPPSTSRQLCRDDDIWYEEGDLRKAQVDTNDPFKCCIMTSEGTIVPYEKLQKQPEDSFILQLSITTASDDDTGADPDWAKPRNCAETDDEEDDVDEIVPYRKRKATQLTKITSTPMTKRRKEKRRGITILGSGKSSRTESPPPVSSPSPSPSPNPSPRARPSPSLQSTLSPTASISSESRQDLSVEVALLRADVATIMDNQRRIMAMLASLSRGSTVATTDTTPQTSPTDPRLWDLWPVDIPETLTDTTVRETIEKRSAGDAVAQAKEACGGTRESLAKELFSLLFTLGDTYGSNVYGRAMGRQQARKPMRKEIIDQILEVCFQVFPTHPQGKKATSSCVNAINTYNRYMWNRRLSTTTLPVLPAKFQC